MHVSGLVAVVEVQRDGDLRVELDRGLHQVPEEEVVACTRARRATPG